MTAVARVRSAYAAIAEADRPEIWIALRPISDALVDAKAVDIRLSDGADLPLAGLLAAVKNNIDVAGIATTAACPGYATEPAAADAEVVARLRAAGAVVIGATNLDQFATGLVGTRSPHGAVRDARRPEHISGGSSSGSAVAVALGLVDIALGTDTAGSGRVPAALQGIVGVKPTVGVVPVDGVIPACRSFDCVTVFARDIDTADVAMGVLAGGARPFPPDAPLAVPAQPRVAIPRELPGLSPLWQQMFRDACARLAETGVELVEIDLTPFLAAARLLYDGGLVAERYEAVGAYLDAHRDDPAAGIDPTVDMIITAAGTIAARTLLADRTRLAELTDEAMATLGDCAALLIPTTTGHPTIAEVQADPVGVNSQLGIYTNFCNLLDLCAVAVPSGTDDQTTQFGVTVVARAGADALALELARLVELRTDPVALPGSAGSLPAPATPWPVRSGLPATTVLVVGAHLRGQPLEWQLTGRGARWSGPATTAPLYRLARLDTTPPKPGLVRVGRDRGTAIEGELWLVGTAMLGEFLAELPDPMSLGRVLLADGSEVVGFGCSLDAWRTGADISHHGDWRSYLRRLGPGAPAARSEVTGRCWRRRTIVAPGTAIDTTTSVQWLQADRAYVDLRIPAGLAPVTASSHAALTRDDLMTMGAVQAFAGTVENDGAEWTWHRAVDLHPREPLPDRGRLHLADGLLIETGIGREYVEDWQARSDGPEHIHLELTLRDESGRTGLLLCVGDRFGYVRGRAAGDQPDGDRPLRETISAAGLDRARALMDLEISLGTVDGAGWRITDSTLPYRVGDDLAPDTVAGESVSTSDRDRDGTTMRRRWTVRPPPLPPGGRKYTTDERFCDAP